MARIVLALVPHPNDLEFYAGSTFARLIAEGASGMIVIATNGSKGSYESETEPLVRIRRAEAQRAAAVLGVETPLVLGHQDMEIVDVSETMERRLAALTKKTLAAGGQAGAATMPVKGNAGQQPA